MTKQRNILWIMCDQLRFDYLSCYGHDRLHTPNIDRLAERGVRFNNAYVQATVCGPSRMSAYTGRYMRSHGSTQNAVPLRVGEPTLGDHLSETGTRCVLIGKTHMRPDLEGMKRLGIDPASEIGARVAEGGFEAFDRDDGVHPTGYRKKEPAYNAYLRHAGFQAENPWEFWANSAEGADGTNQSGWLLTHADKPARIPEEHSETAYMTRRAMAFMEAAEADGRPWCAHLSYIKPHWPYIVPAPYHDMYGPEDVKPAVRSSQELENAHPLFKAITEEVYSRNFSRDEVREKVIPAYMGLIKQIDDQLGQLFAFMDERGLTENTMIVFTSDHGDYLGDHWMGEKYMFYQQAAKVPLIVVDPSSEADATRGSVSDALVEMIDLAPTFVEYTGGTPAMHILEGRSLMPLLRDSDADWTRTHVFSELDYSNLPARLKLGRDVQDCRATMVFDGRFKMIEVQGMRPMLFDLQTDPDELIDLGEDVAQEDVRRRLRSALDKWHRDTRLRITKSDEAYRAMDPVLRESDPDLVAGVVIGYWDEEEVEAEQRKIARILSQSKD
ncbi:sulfatase-like hydrolase/transferase [Nioella sediminis]|jgi:arylsulfatase A-like enzyme|uniref:sulfatase-like hydrolase/transferase n=1 Tax=Nioella sediminis TaxID=1912092 RepID=UPI0008FD6907|nr:sulfatase-like hydrolase/transferase [Nioella sediminis]TBX15057.1 phosphonate monoester hydrolase [Roseovarius sp. JS7-11]